MNSRRNRIASIIMSVILVTMIVLSYRFVIDNLHHDCQGEDCPICCEIEAALHMLSGIRMLPVVPLLVVALILCISICKSHWQIFFATSDLVSLKVEFLD